MWDSVRRLGAGLAGVAALRALGPSAVVGQQPAPAANPNVYVNPLASAGRAAAPSTGRLGYGSLTPSAPSGLGYGTLAASYANPSLGYGTLSNVATPNPYAYGGYGMYGYGMWGTQWMMNPYQGYLMGAADLTRANAEYYSTIQQAKLTRQEAIRSSLETRRAMIEEAEWERQHMPDPEKIRQRTIERALTAARVSPPPNDIWSGRALNTLLRHLITQLGDGAKGPRIPLAPDITKHINVKTGDSVGNVALLKNKGELDWPESLQGSAFKESRDQISALMRRAYKSVDSGNNPDSATLNDLQAQYRKMSDILRNNVSEMKPGDFIEAQRYLKEVGQTITALQDPNIGHQFSGDWKPTKAKFVHELVQHMREKGLLFDSASEEDQAAYMALYHALAAFDAGLARVARGQGEAPENK